MFRNKSHRFFAIFMALIMALSLTGLALAGSVKTQVRWFADGSSVDGSTSQLVRKDGRVKMHINTKELIPGNAYTIWWVVFNNPENCSNPTGLGGLCGEPDLLPFGGDSSVNSSALWATGIVVDNQGGIGNFKAMLSEGNAPGQVLFGGGLLDGNSQSAEIHLIVRDHGPASADPGILDAQLNTYNGGCDIFDCVDVQFAIHAP